MNLAKTHATEHEGNDCWITNTYLLIEDCSRWYVLHHYTVSGRGSVDEWNSYDIEGAENMLDSDVLTALTITPENIKLNKFE